MSLARRAGVALVVVLLSSAAIRAAENWTRFRGPNGLGVLNATNLPIEFGPEIRV